MASLVMQELALHAGVSDSIVSTLKGASQTSDLLLPRAIASMRRRPTSQPGPFPHSHVTAIPRGCRWQNEPFHRVRAIATRDGRYAGHITLSFLQANQLLSLACLRDDN